MVPPSATTVTPAVTPHPYHWRVAGRGDTTQTERRNGWSRPVAIPADVDDPGARKATGVVELPHHVSWSGTKRTWDLNDRRQRARVYEIVLTEGTDEDVRRFIDVDELIELWDRLWLSPHVRAAWAKELEHRRGVHLAC